MNDSETLGLILNISGIIAMLSFLIAAGVDNHYEFYRNEKNERLLLFLSKTFWFIGKVVGAFSLVLLVAMLFIGFVLRVFS